MKKIIPILSVFVLRAILANAQGNCPEINFAEFLSAPFNPNNCTYEISGIPMQLFNVYLPQPQQQFCASPSPDHHVFKAKINKTDLPFSASSDNVGISLVSTSCPGIDFLVFEFYYMDGSHINFTGASIEIENYEDLDYLTVTEIECGLIYGAGGLPATKIKFEVSNEASTPDPSACGNSSVSNLENDFSVPGNNGREDYHSYQVETIICESDNYSGSYTCTIDGVWEFLKSSGNNQAPIKEDYPIPEEFLINAGWLAFNKYYPYQILHHAILKPLQQYADAVGATYSGPIENCQEISLAPSIARVATGIFLNIPTQHDCFTNIDIVNEPIIIVIDEDDKCITNYTLPGHIFHPGKVERCVVSDDCEKSIKIITKGTGFHDCGDNAAGYLMSRLNVFVGVPTFESIDSRVKEKFNQ